MKKNTIPAGRRGVAPLIIILLIAILGMVGYFGYKNFIAKRIKTFPLATSERIDQPTPNGGAYSIIYYKDNDGQPVVKEKAVKVEIGEYSQDGTELMRTYGSVEK